MAGPASPSMATPRHLDTHRPLILERAAVAQAAALLPVPFVDDLLADAARSTLLRRIATARGVGATDEALSILSRITLADDSAPAAAASHLSRRLLRRTFRRLAVAVQLVGHAGDFANTFAIATLFDHYCALHHVGPGLDGPAATRLRAAIDAAIADARRGYAGSGLRRLAGRTSALLLSAPRALLRRVPLLPSRSTTSSDEPTGTRERTRQPERIESAETVRPGDRPPTVGATRVQRSVAAVSGFANAAGRGYIDALVAAFDARWAAASATPAR